jgi:hypothetical protein
MSQFQLEEVFYKFKHRLILQALIRSYTCHMVWCLVQYSVISTILSSSTLYLGFWFCRVETTFGSLSTDP